MDIILGKKNANLKEWIKIWEELTKEEFHELALIDLYKIIRME